MALSKNHLVLFCFVFLVACQNTQPEKSLTSEETPQINKIPETKTSSGVAVEIIEMPLLPKTQKPESGQLRPFDEGQLSPDFQRFRSELLAAIGRRDVDFIKQMIDDHIKIGFGGNDGSTAFIEQWKLESPDSRFWQTLKKILFLGGAFNRQDKNAFSVPFVDAAWPARLDAFEYAVITGENVRIRKEPKLEGAVIGSLTYDVVRRTNDGLAYQYETIDNETWPWMKIVMPDKSGTGYVYGKYIHSPVDYRAYFERKDGRWKMTSFLAGD